MPPRPSRLETCFLTWFSGPPARIHYPLPVPYKGKPDPAVLQREIRALRTQLSAGPSHGGPGHAHPEIQRLRAEWVLMHSSCHSFIHSSEGDWLQNMNACGSIPPGTSSIPQDTSRQYDSIRLHAQGYGQGCDVSPSPLFPPGWPR